MSKNAQLTVIHDDCLNAVRKISDCSIDSCCTDPPYALVSITKRFGKEGSVPPKSDGATGVYKRASSGFMGKQWDTGDRAFAVEFWQEVYRVLKPGAHVAAFGGTRTCHRLACAIEDAGFEIRDRFRFECSTETKYGAFVDGLNDEQRGMLMEMLNDQTGLGSEAAWTFGSGFPKSHNLSGEWEGWGTAVKPAYEPIILARKPLIGTVAENVLAYGTGALNIDASRVGSETRVNGPASSSSMHRKSRVEAGHRHDDGIGPGAAESEVIGRWPANLLHDGSDEILACFPAAPGQLAAISTAQGLKTNGIYGPMKRENEASSARTYADKGATNFAAKPGARRADTGSAARFFYRAKANKTDRAGSKHPTVKPLALMRWLVELVTPPGGVVLDPFAGSGTTLQAAIEQGFSAIGIEREEEYLADIKTRLYLP